MPSGTVLIKHTSPQKGNGATNEVRPKPQQVIQRKKCIIIEDEIKSLLCWKMFQMQKHAPVEESAFAMANKTPK